MNNDSLNAPFQIAQAIAMAEAVGLVEFPGCDSAAQLLTGYSGKKLTGALQRLVGRIGGRNDACYLEIGVFQGLTLHSVAAANPKVSCFGIDNFAYFDPEKKNLGLVLERKKALGNDNVSLINMDYEDALEQLERHIGHAKVAVYFIDGPHDYRSQLMCLELALPYLSDDAVIIVDDSNYEHVRQANRDFLVTHTDFKLVFQGYTPCHPQNMTVAQEDAAREGWWNGVNILCRDPANRMASELPPTNRDRTCFENEHIVHSHSLALHTLPLLSLGDALLRRSPIGVLKALRAFFRSRRVPCRGTVPDFIQLNTYSVSLPESSFNSALQDARRT